MESVTRITACSIILAEGVVRFVQNRITVLGPVLVSWLSIQVLEKSHAISTNFHVRGDAPGEVVRV